MPRKRDVGEVKGSLARGSVNAGEVYRKVTYYTLCIPPQRHVIGVEADLLQLAARCKFYISKSESPGQEQ